MHATVILDLRRWSLKLLQSGPYLVNTQEKQESTVSAEAADIRKFEVKCS